MIQKKYIKLAIDLLNLMGLDESIGEMSLSEFIQFMYKAHGTLFIALTIFKLSQKYVPVDTGNLHDSGKILPLDNGKYRIIYETPYAARQHEDPDYLHAEPTKSKYLEDAAYEILNYSGNSELFTFQLLFPGDGAVALDIDTIDQAEFLRNKVIHDRLKNITWEGLDDVR